MAKEKKIIGREGTVEVDSTIIEHGGGVIGGRQNEKIMVKPFVTDVAHVSVTMGLTIPLQAYASARVSVCVTTPCYVEEVPKVYDDVRNFVSGLIAAEARKINEKKKTVIF